MQLRSDPSSCRPPLPRSRTRMGGLPSAPRSARRPDASHRATFVRSMSQEPWRRPRLARPESTLVSVHDHGPGAERGRQQDARLPYWSTFSVLLADPESRLRSRGSRVVAAAGRDGESLYPDPGGGWPSRGTALDCINGRRWPQRLRRPARASSVVRLAGSCTACPGPARYLPPVAR